METLVVRIALAVLGLAVSARTVVRLPLLGPVPVLGVVALAVVLAIVAAVLLIVRSIVRDWPGPRTVAA
jgi:hypothetical protein